MTDASLIIDNVLLKYSDSLQHMTQFTVFLKVFLFVQGFCNDKCSKGGPKRIWDRVNKLCIKYIAHQYHEGLHKPCYCTRNICSW